MDLELLTCPVCLELATTPRETECCNQVFCLACIRPLQDCPICRANRFTYRENKVVNRMLDAFPATCPFECEAAVTRGNLEAHVNMCEERLFDCPTPNCECKDLKGKAQFFGHMVSQHAKDVESAIQQFYGTKRQNGTVNQQSSTRTLPPIEFNASWNFRRRETQFTGDRPPGAWRSRNAQLASSQAHNRPWRRLDDPGAW